MQQPTPDQAIRVQTVVTARWVARAETRGLRIGTWVLILGSLLLPRPAGAVVGGVNLLVILAQVAWSSRIAARARRELVQADPARLSNVFEQLRGLPGPRRTFEALHAALAGVGVTSGTTGPGPDRAGGPGPERPDRAGEPGPERPERLSWARRLITRPRAVDDLAKPAVDDGLTCYERGSHVPGCPHRPLDGSGLS